MRLGNWLQVPGRDGGYIMEIKKKKLGQVAAEEAEDDTEYY
jgi:hypothetical protein